jgi:serine/threonine protein kinase
MGEVYRARDTKLDREVAVKVLPAAVAQDRERLARFEREAKILASLNHPNIAQIYGLEEDGDIRALVMELVPGSTLLVPQPIATAVNYSRQIAEALAC